MSYCNRQLCSYTSSSIRCYVKLQQVAVREELDQYSDSFKLVTNHREEYCKLFDAENQQHEEL